MPSKFGSPGVPMYGYDVRLVDEATGARHRRAGPERASSPSTGRRRPASCRPSGATTRASSRPTGRASPGASVYNTFDWGIRDADGYCFILGRTDDVINVAGHRLGTREIEESISSHPNVAEVAVVGVADALKGQVAMAFVDRPRRVGARRRRTARLQLEGDIMKTVDGQLGALARPARVHFVTALPKTRSGKLLRRAIQAICERRDAGDLTTIEDPTALQQIRDLVDPSPEEPPCHPVMRLRCSPPRLIGGAASAARHRCPGRRFRASPSAAAHDRRRATPASPRGDRASRRSRSTRPTRAGSPPGTTSTPAIEDVSAPIGLLENVASRQGDPRRGAGVHPALGRVRLDPRPERAALSRAAAGRAARRDRARVRQVRARRLRGFGRRPGAGRSGARQAAERPHRRPRPAVRSPHPRRQRQGAGRRRRAGRRARGRLEGQAARRRRQGAARPRLPDPGCRCSSAPRRHRRASCSGAPR